MHVNNNHSCNFVSPGGTIQVICVIYACDLRQRWQILTRKYHDNRKWNINIRLALH